MLTTCSSHHVPALCGDKDAAPTAPGAVGSNSELSMDSSQEISDFYALIRDYWCDLSSVGASERSCMLNFGFWPEGVETLHEAQQAFLDRILLDGPQLPTGQCGLEIGCGIGGISINVLLRRTGVHMTALDIAEPQLALARGNAARYGVQDRFIGVAGNSMELPLGDAQFDFSLCIESSFHYDDKERFLREAFRTLKPGGVMVLADITCRRIDAIRFRQGNHFESPETYLRLVEKTGFELQSAQDIGPQVYGPLYRFLSEFNLTQRSAVSRYWSLVLSNYSQLVASGDMGYYVFTLRKPL